MVSVGRASGPLLFLGWSLCPGRPFRSPGLPTITPTSDLTALLFCPTRAVRWQSDSVHSVPLHGFVSCTEKLSGEQVKAAPDPKGQAHDIYGFSTIWC